MVGVVRGNPQQSRSRSFLCCRIHLTRHIENQGLRQKLVKELQGLVELVYGDQQVDPDVLEDEYVERVLLLRKV